MRRSYVSIFDLKGEISVSFFQFLHSLQQGVIPLLQLKDSDATASLCLVSAHWSFDGHLLTYAF
jgi:hypothetical protein